MCAKILPKRKGKGSTAAVPSPSAFRILIVDDHPIVRNGLRQLIEPEKDFDICGEAGTSSEARSMIERYHPQLVLLDIAIEGSNGIEFTKWLKEVHPEIAVLIISMHDENLYAERALKAGASGYIMKQEAPDAVLTAIRRVLSGGLYVSPRISENIIRGLSQPAERDTGRRGLESLSDRELEVYELVGKGCRTSDIAEKLCLSIKTIEAHRAHIKQKLKLRNSSELVRHAVRWAEDVKNPD